jgi:RHS repeat-associated protein
VLDPTSFSGAGSGWSVSPASGALSLKVPLATIPGEIPIPLCFQYWATSSLIQNVIPAPSVNELWETPIRGRVLFDSGLDDPNALLESDLVPYSPPDGKPLVAPTEFGFSAKGWPQVQMHTSGQYIYYLAESAELGRWSAKVATLVPQGIGGLDGRPPAGIHCTVLMSRNIAQVCLFTGGAGNTMTLPILWVDRFGHFVSFKWTLARASPELYVFSVLALNQRGLGVQAQWAQRGKPAAVTSVAETLFRADFIGFQAPSVQIEGYQGDVPNAQTLGIPGRSFIDNRGGFGTLAFRPTRIRVDNPANLETPSWVSAGLPIPAATGTDPWAPGLTWGFAYTPNLAELASFTDPLGIITTFSYETKFFYAGRYEDGGRWRWAYRTVSSANSVDGNTGVQFNRTWTRVVPGYEIYHYPVHWTSYDWVTTLNQSYSAGNPAEVPSQEWTFAGPDQPVHYANGAVLSHRVHTPGKTWATETNTLAAGGINGTLSLITATTSAVDGVPINRTTTTWDATGSLPIAQSLSVGETTWQSVLTSYDTDMGRLNPGRPASVATCRWVNGSPVSAPLQSFVYDRHGLLTLESTGSGDLVRGRHVQYDPEGHITGVDLFGTVAGVSTTSSGTSYVIDSMGLPSYATTSFSTPGGAASSIFTATFHNPAGMELASMDARGVFTRRTYDSRGRTLSQATPGSPAIQNAYPTEFTTTWATTDGRKGSATTDGFGRVVTRELPDGITQAVEYDLLGRQSRVKETNAQGAVRSSAWQHDPLGRLVKATTYASPLGTSIAYKADGTSTATVTTLDNGVTTQVWKDPIGRVVKTSTPKSEVTTSYNALNQPLQIRQTAGAAAQLRTFSYDGLGHLIARNDPETGTTTFGGFDALGNPTRIEDGARTRTFAYDGLGRLCSVTTPTPAGWNNFTFPPLSDNRLPAQTANGALSGWTLNAHGEAVQIGITTGATSLLNLGWDPMGRLSSVQSASLGLDQTFTYGPNGCRLQTLDALRPSRSRMYACSSQGLLLGEGIPVTGQSSAPANLAGSPSPWLREVFYLGSQAIAETESSGVHEMHDDHLQSPRVITSGSTGKIEGTQGFGPYGEYLYGTGYVPLTGYTGHIQTEPNGLIYMRGRFYSPAWHCFMNPDQGADPNSLNQYAYAGGNPFINVDPSGMWYLRSVIGDLDHGIRGIGHDASRGWSHLRGPVELCAVAVASYYTFGAVSGWAGGGVLGGMAGGAAAGTVSGYAMGGNLRSAEMGALSGAIFGGVNGACQGLGMGTFATGLTNSVIAGAYSQANGGSFSKGFIAEAELFAASAGFQSLVGSLANPTPGTDRTVGVDNAYVEENGIIPQEWRDNNYNVFGLNRDAGWNCQSNVFSNIMDTIPGMNAIAQFHDTIFLSGGFGIPFTGYTNVPCMIPAAFISYGAIKYQLGYGVH